MNPQHIVEAALFSAGRPLSVEEIADQTDLRRKDVEKAVKILQKAYEERDTVLEVGKAGTKWAMQVRTLAAEPAAKFAPMEIAPKLLKTLALIAYHQPMKQSDLKDMIGSKVYDHVPELKERGLVKTRKDGQTKILTVTSAFPEYFGLDAATPEEIRVTLAKAVGLDPAKAQKELPKEAPNVATEGQGAADEHAAGQAESATHEPATPAAPANQDAESGEARSPETANDAVLAAVHE